MSESQCAHMPVLVQLSHVFESNIKELKVWAVSKPTGIFNFSSGALPLWGTDYSIRRIAPVLCWYTHASSHLAPLEDEVRVGVPSSTLVFGNEPNQIPYLNSL